MSGESSLRRVVEEMRARRADFERQTISGSVSDWTKYQSIVARIDELARIDESLSKALANFFSDGDD